MFTITGPGIPFFAWFVRRSIHLYPRNSSCLIASAPVFLSWF